MNDKDPQGDVASSQRPRSPRVPVEFALEVEGTDAAGNPFQTKATATKISRGGATIAIDVDVTVGSVNRFRIGDQHIWSKWSGVTTRWFYFHVLQL